jgi:hypothetical protein
MRLGGGSVYSRDKTKGPARMVTAQDVILFIYQGVPMTLCDAHRRGPASSGSKPNAAARLPERFGTRASQNRLLRMQVDELYLDFATRCLKRAAGFSEPAHRGHMIKMAQDCVELAEELRTRVRREQQKLTAEMARTSGAPTDNSP